MSKIQVPTKEYVDNFSHPIAIICNENTDTIVIDFYRSGKFAGLLIWTYNEDVCLYGLTVQNTGKKEGSSVAIYTIFKGPGSASRNITAYVVSVDEEKIVIGLTTNVKFWDVATVIAPCKTSGHAHN